MKLSGIGHAIGDVFEHTGRKISKVAEAPGTRKGFKFKSLLGVGAAGGVFYGVSSGWQLATHRHRSKRNSAMRGGTTMAPPRRI
mmetsp:Transcript_34775/g.110623  ORF Transcript_34775/g.110623 Transcript_34775/m.110623 type:complete len:84 (-) Transcript_34775:40-291(-)|eukprot:scaffold1849_cov107-Isochrysis_galbana.AAC.17